MRARDGMDETVEVLAGPDGPAQRAWWKALLSVGMIIAVGLAARTMAEPGPPTFVLSAAQVPTTTVAAARSATPTTPPTAVSPTAAPSASSTSAPPTVLPGRERAFCEVAKSYLLRVRTLSISLSAGDRARNLAAGAPATAQLAVSAPSEVRADVVVLSEAVTTLAAKLEGTGYDLSRLAPDALMSLQSPPVLKAMSGIDAWAQRAC